MITKATTDNNKNQRKKIQNIIYSDFVNKVNNCFLVIGAAGEYETNVLHSRSPFHNAF